MELINYTLNHGIIFWNEKRCDVPYLNYFTIDFAINGESSAYCFVEYIKKCMEHQNELATFILLTTGRGYFPASPKIWSYKTRQMLEPKHGHFVLEEHVTSEGYAFTLIEKRNQLFKIRHFERMCSSENHLLVFKKEFEGEFDYLKSKFLSNPTKISFKKCSQDDPMEIGMRCYSEYGEKRIVEFFGSMKGLEMILECLASRYVLKKNSIDDLSRM